MGRKRLSLILVPTLACDADCDYCFERKNGLSMELDRLDAAFARVVEYASEVRAAEIEVNWQGGEVTTLGPGWVERAAGDMERRAREAGLLLVHGLQTNALGDLRPWRDLIRDLFGGAFGTSMDFPNLHRRTPGGDPAEFTRRWRDNTAWALGEGFGVGVIALPNTQSVALGAERFYRTFFETYGVRDVQINLPFTALPEQGGTLPPPPAPEALADFLVALVDLWLADVPESGRRLGPWDAVLDRLRGLDAQVPCVWRPNCADEFIALGPTGWVAQCDCWLTAPERFRYGELFASTGLAALLGTSPARELFLSRPERLVAGTVCGDCEYLGLCHGGCPARARGFGEDILVPDPNCAIYQRLFAHLRRAAHSGPARAAAQNLGEARR